MPRLRIHTNQQPCAELKISFLSLKDEHISRRRIDTSLRPSSPNHPLLHPTNPSKWFKELYVEREIALLSASRAPNDRNVGETGIMNSRLRL